MLRKKNYKEEQHFTQHYSFTAYSLPTSSSPSKRCVIYFKRYRPLSLGDTNLYDLINGKLQSNNKEVLGNVEYPVDRTLEMISFDANLNFLRQLMRKVGKIRKYETGEGVYKGEKIWTAMCVFKYEFDLVKSFRDGYIQNIMDEQCLSIKQKQEEDDREEQRYDLIQKYMGEELAEKVEAMKKMQEGGFQVVTDRYGQYKMDIERNSKFVENLPQLKKKQKLKNKMKKQLQ